MGYSPSLNRWLSPAPINMIGEGVELLDAPPRLSGYNYAYNSPLNYMSPSGVAVAQVGDVFTLVAEEIDVGAMFPFPAIPATACAGTDCDVTKGIITNWNKKPADKTCFDGCKQLVVEAHEATHRKNMGPCCTAHNKAITGIVGQPGVPIAEKKANLLQVKKLWAIWKKVAELELEVLAAVSGCKVATKLLATCGVITADCRAILEKEKKLECGNADPTGKVPCCPWDAAGHVDKDCLAETLKTYKKMLE